MPTNRTRLDVTTLDILSNDPTWSEGVYPLDETPENDFLIGLQDSPDVIVSPEPLPPESLEPGAKQLSPFPEKFGPHTRPSKFAYPKDREVLGVPPTIHTGKYIPEYVLTGDDGQSLLPSFLLNTVDRWLSPPDLDSIGGYIGQVVEPGITAEEYIDEDTEFALKNQLQVGIRSTGDPTNTDLNMTWQEMLTKMESTGLDISKTDKFFATKKFSYQPPVSHDKFANFRYYYWTKTLGEWDVTLDSTNESGLILINGSLVGVLDLLIGDFVRVNGIEFIVQSFDILTNTITIHDVSESIYLVPLTELTNTLVMHDRPSYHVQASSTYTTNKWITNNHWTHLDDLTPAELLIIDDFPKAAVPIIELNADVVLDPNSTSTYTKTAPPNVRLHPLQHVDFNQTTLPNNIEETLSGYNAGVPNLVDKEGFIPVVYKPVLEYVSGTTHLDGELTEFDNIIGFNAVKATIDSGDYIFRNGLVDNTNNDVRQNRFFVYSTQVDATTIEKNYTYNQQTLDDEWVVVHNLGYIPVVRVFLPSGDEIQPLKITSDETTTVIEFTNALTGIASFT